ncbi:MAG: ATP synthase F0 subunit C [Bdellovibrionales bacterium]|nr:ATP synthase F0 subunit C [Bdellovibrionales bacterium]
MKKFITNTYLFGLTFFASAIALADDGGATDWKKPAAALALGIAAFGGALGQGKAATAALDGIARNPAAAGKIQTPMIIALALIESLVIYALVVNFV